MMAEIRDDSSSSSSTDPPSLNDLPVKQLRPLYVHRQAVTSLLSTDDEDRSPPSSLTSSLEQLKPSTTPSTLYTLTRRRSRPVFIEKRKPPAAPPANPTSNPMAVHLARRQAQAARIMAGGDHGENATLIRPCRLDLHYKSPRRLRQGFRYNRAEEDWESQYIGDMYFPVEVAQEIGHWKPNTPKAATPDLPLITMASPERSEGCCPVLSKFYNRRQVQFGPLPEPNTSRGGPSPTRTPRNVGITEEELQWAMKRSCRIRRPWPTIVEKLRSARGELRYAGIKLLAGLLEARANGGATILRTGDMSAAALTRSVCYDDDQSRLDYVKRRNQDPCVPDWVLQILMPLIAPLTPRRGYTLLSENLEKAQNHLQTLSENALLEIQNSLIHLNLNQLAHLRVTLPQKPVDGSLRKARLKELVRSCEQLVGDRFWQFLCNRVRPSSIFYELLLERATNALLDHKLLDQPILSSARPMHARFGSPYSHSSYSSLPDGGSTLGLSSDAPSLDSACKGTPDTRLRYDPTTNCQPLIEVPKLRPPVRQQIGLSMLETMGVLELSSSTRAELLEDPVETLSHQQSWWLVFTGELTKGQPPARPLASTRHIGTMRSPTVQEFPPDVVPSDFQMCFLRIPSMELRFARPSDSDIFTINELVKADTLIGASTWAIRVIPAEVENLAALAPQDPTKHLESLLANNAFLARRAQADAHALTRDQITTTVKPRQRLRSISRTRTHFDAAGRAGSRAKQAFDARKMSKRLSLRTSTLFDWLSPSQKPVADIDVYGTSAV